MARKPKEEQDEIVFTPDQLQEAWEKAAAVKDAERRQHEAEADKAIAEARLANAQAQKAEYDAVKAEIDYGREVEKRQNELSSDDHARVYQFNEVVGSTTVEKCIKTLSRWSRVDPGCDIELIFSSPGGSVLAGMSLFDFLQSLKRDGHKITTKARGYAASMAGILLQVGDERVMERESWLLLHEGSAGASGSMGEIQDTVEWFKKIDERILNIFYDRSHAKPKKNQKPLARATIKKRYRRKDWWLSSDEAYVLNFCDRVE